MTVQEILDEHGVPWRSAGETPHVTHGWLGAVCPWCGEGTGKFGLGFRLDSLACTCWKCGPHSAVDALAALTGQPWQRIKELLGSPEPLPREERPRGVLKLPAGAGPLLPRHRAYLRRRGFDPDELARIWGVGGIGLAARLAWRLLIPVAFRGRTVSWTTRDVTGRTSLRYVSARPDEEERPAKSVLYGIDHVRHAAVVVEGPADAWRIGPGAVATLGTGWTAEQLALLAAVPVRAVAFDRDPEAQRRAAALCEALAPFPGRTARVELSAADPGAAAADEVAELRRRFLD